MSKKIVSLIIFVLMTFGCFHAFAAEVSVVARYDAGVKVNLNGNAEGNMVVSLFKEGSEVPAFIRQFEAEGKYSFNILLASDTESGKYIVYVTTAAGKAYDTFSFINAEKSAEALALLADAKSAAQAKSIAESNATDLGIDTDDPNYKPNSDEIFTLLYNQGVKYEDASDFNAAYYKMFALAAIHGGSNDTVGNMLEKYQSQLGIDFEAEVSGDSKLTKDAVERLYKVLSATDFVSEFESRGSADFIPVFTESKMTAAVDAAADWQGIKKAFEDFSDLNLLLSDETFKKVSDKDAVYSKMMSYTYNNISDIEDGFEKAVSFVYEDETSKSKGSGGRGGAGTGGAGYSGTVTPSYVEETFEKPTDLGFSDFDNTHWSFDAVEALCEKGIINGYEDGTFRPEQTISRAEFTKLIISISDLLAEVMTEDNSAEIMFDDVSNDLWFSDYVLNAAKKGLLNGDGNLFRPYDNITRQDAAVIIYRLVSQHKSIGGNKVFSDRSDISEYAREAVASLADSGLIAGVGDNKFAPLVNLTRAQSAQLLWNTLEFLK